MKSLFLILLYMFIMQMKTSAEDDIRGETQGYCTTMVSRRESQRISYLETYRERNWGIFYKTKYRWNYRTTYHIVWDIEERCCFLYEKRNDRCEAICFHDCGNGDCIRPNICSCYHGYTATLPSHGPICVPHCENPCVHGVCTAPNECVCDKGYRITPDGFTCEPVCQPDCDSKSAVCTAPNTCSCREGYTKFGITSCLPICKETCLDGRCTAPDTCTCNEGYAPDFYDRFICNPVCDKCTGGICTMPGVCVCKEGYSLNNEGICEPVCNDGCHMGICIAPGICMCHDGYGFSNDSTNVCEPVCPKACINGFCVKPDVCECHEGYEVTGDETSLHICKPHCNIRCEPDGDCTAPNVCTCHEGYSLVDANDGVIFFYEHSMCKPVCDQQCVNGFCISPGECECSIGYEQSDDRHICKPICGHSCQPHSTCTEPNICTCDQGYQHRIRDFENSCEPICEQECVNGFCSSPGKCSCFWGYVESEVNVCKPVCESGCWLFSSCTAPEVCTCNEGYNLIIHPNSSFKCEPICQPACPSNSICGSPGKCICNEGYRLIQDNEFTTCEPFCEFPCHNGTCTSPNYCTCELGFVNDESGSCIPHCTIGCGNGTCIEPDVCSCDEGYALSNGSLTCEPYCENNCDNGDCVAPDDCRCHDGFFKNGNDSACINACKNACNEKGDCIDDRGNCDCYFGWGGTICDEPTVCVVVLSEEYQINKTLSLEKTPNSSMILASASNPTCQQCLNEINNQTICYESLYDDIGERNYSAICFVDASSMCYATHSPTKEVLKVSVAVGGLAVLIMIISISAAYLKFRKNKKTVDIGKLSNAEVSKQNLLSEDSTNL